MNRGAGRTEPPPPRFVSWAKTNAKLARYAAPPCLPRSAPPPCPPRPGAGRTRCATAPRRRCPPPPRASEASAQGAGEGGEARGRGRGRATASEPQRWKKSLACSIPALLGIFEQGRSFRHGESVCAAAITAPLGRERRWGGPSGRLKREASAKFGWVRLVPRVQTRIYLVVLPQSIQASPCRR